MTRYLWVCLVTAGVSVFAAIWLLQENRRGEEARKTLLGRIEQLEEHNRLYRERIRELRGLYGGKPAASVKREKVEKSEGQEKDSEPLAWNIEAEPVDVRAWVSRRSHEIAQSGPDLSSQRLVALVPVGDPQNIESGWESIRSELLAEWRAQESVKSDDVPFYMEWSYRNRGTLEPWNRPLTPMEKAQEERLRPSKETLTLTVEQIGPIYRNAHSQPREKEFRIEIERD